MNEEKAGRPTGNQRITGFVRWAHHFVNCIGALAPTGPGMNGRLVVPDEATVQALMEVTWEAALRTEQALADVFYVAETWARDGRLKMALPGVVSYHGVFVGILLKWGFRAVWEQDDRGNEVQRFVAPPSISGNRMARVTYWEFAALERAIASIEWVARSEFADRH